MNGSKVGIVRDIEGLRVGLFVGENVGSLDGIDSKGSIVGNGFTGSNEGQIVGERDGLVGCKDGS